MVFFTMLLCLTSLGNGIPFYATFIAAKATAIEIFKIIDRVIHVEEYLQSFLFISVLFF